MTLKESLVEFLRDAVSELALPREKERAAALQLQLADCADEGDTWRSILGDLEYDAVSFSRCVHLVALYLDNPPRATKPGRGASLLRSALAAGSYDLATLLGAAEDRYFWVALEQLLPELALEGDLPVRVAGYCSPKGNLSADGLRGWAEAHLAPALESVRTHLGELVRLSVMGHHGLVALVEGAVAGGATVGWRDQVVAQLLADVDESVHALGVQLVCWAWPSGTEVGERHDRVAETVAVSPRARARPALQALRRDLVFAPSVTIDTVLRVVAMVHIDALDVKTATAFSEPALGVIGSALYQLRVRQTPAFVDGRIRDLVLVTTPAPHTSVDAVLTELYRSEPDAAYEVLAAWLSRFAAGLRGVSMLDLLSLLVHEVGPGVMARWYVGLLTSDSAPLRGVAANLLAYENPPRLDPDAIAALPTNKFEALVHQLLGIQAVPAEAIIRLLLSFVAVRPSDGVFLMAAALEVANLYPGACRDEVTRRRVAGASTLTSTATTEIENALLRVLEERSARLAKVLDCPEVASGSPGLREYRLFEERQQRRMMAEAQDRSVFAHIAARQPIACGDGTVRHPEGKEAVKFIRYGHSSELPTAAAIDPLGNDLERINHLKRADALLTEGSVSDK